MEYNQKVISRLKKVEGQIRGVLRMMEKEKDCRDVITQLSAIRAAIDRTIGVIVTDNFIACLRKEKDAWNEKNEAIKEAIDLLVKSR